MARSSKITENEVFDAANALIAQGKEVSPTALLSALGSGSFTTIYKHLTTWELKKASEVVNNPPTEIPESVKTAFANSWRTATAEAAKEVVAVKQKAAEEVHTALKKLQEAVETIERLESQSEADASLIESLTGKLTDTEKELQKAENEIAGLKARTGELNKRVASQDAELERVHKELDGERKRHDEERSQANAAAAAAQEKANSQIEHFRQELAAAKSELEKAKHDAELKVREASNRADKADGHVSKIEKELDSLRKEKDSAVKESAVLLGQIEALKEQNSELMTRLGSSRSSKPESKG